MLYPFHLIREERLYAPADVARRPPQIRFLELTGVLNDLFHCVPEVLTRADGCTMTLLYRDVVYLAQDIAERIGPSAAAAQLRLFGTSEKRETVEMRFFMDGEAPVMQLRSVSGKEFDHLQGLGVQMKCGSWEEMQQLARLVSALPAATPFCICIDARDRAAAEAWGVLAATPGSLYGYWAETAATERELLRSLSFQQKAVLWNEFLGFHQQPAEFGWLWSCYYDQNECLFLLEWELALRLILDELHYRVDHQDGFFRVTDREGRECRFDFVRGGPAEKVFLKLLFPVDTK